MHHHLGHIFISHTSADKPLVRQLADRLRTEGFQIWLDERDILVGDPLAKRISEALASTRVVLVVVSSASIQSKWLRYELNVATERMVKGECRVIPIVIDETPLPEEVRGLLYADCRQSLSDGLPAILTALQYESRQASMERAFWSRADTLIHEVFGGTGSASIGSEYKSHDYEFITLPVQDENGDDMNVFYDVVPNYLASPNPLTEIWWKEYVNATQEMPEALSLVVTERSVEFPLDAYHPTNNHVGVRRLRHTSIDLLYRQVVFVNLAKTANEADQKQALVSSRELLMQCAEIIPEEIQRFRDRHARRETESA